VREEAQYPDVSGDAAIDGTGSHLLLELCLIEEVTPDYYNGRIIGVNHEDKPEGWLVSQDRIDRVWMCINYINRRKEELLAQFPGSVIDVQAETKTDPGGMFGREDWKGTADVTITVMIGGQAVYVEVVDYKDGRGWVNAEGNSQLISYLGGQMRKWIASGPDMVRPFRPERLQGCRMTIVQPKTTPPIRYSDVMPRGVLTDLEQLAKAAWATDDPDAPLKSGKHCTWCKHKLNCTAQSEESLEVLKMTTDIVAQDGQSLFELIENVIGDVESIDTQRLTELADAEAGIQAAFDRVKAELTARLEQGEQVDGYALKPGRSSRIWNESEDEIVKMLKARRLKRDDIYPPKLASPAQIMKHPDLTDDQKAKIEKQYIATKAGELKLTKVARGQKSELPFKDVVQTTTDDVPSFL
jgi:hypothetical protein